MQKKSEPMVIVGPRGKRTDEAQPYDALIPVKRFRVGEFVLLPVGFADTEATTNANLRSASMQCKIVQIHTQRKWFRVTYQVRGVQMSECYKYVMPEV